MSADDLMRLGDWAIEHLTAPVGVLAVYFGMIWAVRKAGWPWPLNIGSKEKRD